MRAFMTLDNGYAWACRQSEASVPVALAEARAILAESEAGICATIDPPRGSQYGYTFCSECHSESQLIDTGARYDGRLVCRFCLNFADGAPTYAATIRDTRPVLALAESLRRALDSGVFDAR